MTLVFQPWMNLSLDFAGVPGSGLTAVNWGSHFALYATDNTGKVRSSGVYLQTGIMGPWGMFTEGFDGVPGQSVAAVKWGQRHALFAIGNKGQAMCAGGEPENGLMAPWKMITEGFETKPGSSITALAWGSRFALFATDLDGRVCCAGADPQHGLTTPWKVITTAFAGTPGAPVTALPWGKRFALFAIDAGGVVRCAGGDPQHGLVDQWEPISDDFVGVPGGPISAQPWGNHFALFATDDQGNICLAGDYLETGLMGPWKIMSDGFVGQPGASVAVVPWNEVFVLVAADYAGVVRVATGNPEINLTAWEPIPAPPAPEFVAAAGSPATLVTQATGLGVFSTDFTGAAWGAAGGAQVFTGFWPDQHGWHFDNTFVNQLFGGLLTTNGLCGGMAYSSLDYYFNGIPIPTHRYHDFPDGDFCPPDGRLHSMIYNRLIDSFRDNFGKWACIYPELDGAVAAALGIVVTGGGILGGLLGGIGGWIYGEIQANFECPGGGAPGMTRKELPRLLGDFLDNGKPAPIGLVYNRDIFKIGRSHQAVAYGYVVVGPQTFIYIYDNRFHDTVFALGVDTANPQKINQYLGDLTTAVSPDMGIWEGLLVEDGYRSQKPTYGQDIAISTPLALQMTGSTINVPVAADPTIMAKIGGSPPASATGAPDGAVQLVFVPQLTQTPGAPLTVSYAVQNMGEFPAHYESLGIEIDAPDGGVTITPPTPPMPPPSPNNKKPVFNDNILQPGATQTVVVSVADFGDAAGDYAVRAGYNSVPYQPELMPPGTWPYTNCRWLTIVWPPSLVPVG